VIDLGVRNVNDERPGIPEAGVERPNRRIEIQAGEICQRDIDCLFAIQTVLTIVGQADVTPTSLVEDDGGRVPTERLQTMEVIGDPQCISPLQRIRRNLLVRF